MSGGRADSNLDALLLAYDEALAEGQVPASVVFAGHKLGSAALDELQAQQACLQLLEAVWPRQASAVTSWQRHVDAVGLAERLLERGVEESQDARPLRTLDELKQAVAESELISLADMEESLADLSPEHVPQSVEQLAYELVQRNILNSDQATTLCRGDLQRLLLGEYLILEELGRGGMGVVYKALDRQRNRYVALKTLHQNGSEAIFRIKREFRTLANLAHRNLVVLDELRSIDGRWFFTMELVQGQSFTTYHRAGQDGPDRLRRSLGQLAEGLSVLHAARVLHCDIKPSNVLVTGEGRVVLLDFGIASQQGVGDGGAKHTRQVGGTAPYMSPEQSRGEPLSEATDWYSVGVMLWETLTGKRPFAGSCESMLREKQQGPPALPAGSVPGIYQNLVPLCQSLLSPAPTNRATGATILAHLKQGAVHNVSLPARAIQEQSSVFVGRRQELRCLEDAYQQMSGGQTAIVYVGGESGIGKSALVRHFLKGIEPSAIVLGSRCYEKESVPFKAMDGIIDALIAHLSTSPATEVDQLLPAEFSSLVRMFPALRQLPSARLAAREPVPADDREVRQRGVRSLRTLLARLRQDTPVVLFIDDLQWGDIDSAALLEELFRPPEVPPLLLIGCYRREGVGSNPCMSRLLERDPTSDNEVERRQLALSPLSEQDSTEMSYTLLGSEYDRHVGQVAEVLREARGSPYFIQELLDHLKKHRRQPTLHLQTLLENRLEQLPPAARRLLETFAIAGHPIRIADAEQVARLTESQQEFALLRAENLLRACGTGANELETFHDRIRESISSQLDPVVVRECHGRLAHVLEERAEADPELLWQHFQAAGQAENAGHYAITAADRAAESLAFDHAAQLYQEAIDFALLETDERRESFRKLAESLANAGQNVEAADRYLQAAELATDAEQLDYRRLAADHFLRAGKIDEGRELLASVLQVFGMKIPKTWWHSLARVVWTLTYLRLRGTDYRERAKKEVSQRDLVMLDTTWSAATVFCIIEPDRGLPFIAQFVAQSLRVGEPRRATLAVAMLGMMRGHSASRLEEQEGLFQRSDEHAELIDFPYSKGSSAMWSSAVAMFTGQWRKSIRRASESEAIFREQCTGIRWELSQLAFAWIGSLFFLGEIMELRRRVPEVLLDANEVGDVVVAVVAQTYFGNVAWLAADQAEEARYHAEQALAAFPRDSYYFQNTLELIGSASIDLYAGQGQQALRRLAQREGKSQGIRPNRFFRDVVIHLRARAAIASATASGNRDRRHVGIAAKAARRLRRSKLPWCRPLGSLVQAGVACAQNNEEAAKTLLQAVVPELDAAEMHLYAAAARRRLGDLLGGDDGANLVSDGTRFMTNQGIVAPDRMTRMLAPGFRDPE